MSVGHWGLSMGIWEGSGGYFGYPQALGRVHGAQGDWISGVVEAVHRTLGWGDTPSGFGDSVWPQGESKGHESGSPASWDMSCSSAGGLRALGWLDCHRRHWSWDIRADKPVTFVFLGVSGQGQSGNGHGHVGVNGIWD